MPHPSWLNVNPDSGTGNATIVNTVITEYNGRLARNGVVSATATGVDGIASYNVIQDAVPEYLTFDAGDVLTISAVGGTIHVLGKTNTNKLTISFMTGDVQVAVPTYYIINGDIIVANGAIIPNDPGANAKLIVDIPILIDLNDNIFDKRTTMWVNVGDSGFVVLLDIIQTKADARLTTNVSDISIAQQGTVTTFAIASNTNWAIS